jgi:hypothetical protein
MNRPSLPESNSYRLLEALKAHERGWALMPLSGKTPTQKGWQQRPKPTEEQVRQWAQAGNVGLRTGSVSGIMVVDWDGPVGSEQPPILNSIPPTPTVKTGGGGRHFYLKMPEGIALGNTVSKLAPHVDTRGQGGQVVFPGSIHPETGQMYRWAEGRSPDEVPLAEVPPEILELLRPPKRVDPLKIVPPSHPTLSHYAQKALTEEANRVRSAPEGSRNDTLNAAAFKLGQLVPHILGKEAVTEELTRAALEAGLGVREATSTIESGLTAGMAEPRQPSRRDATEASTPRPRLEDMSGDKRLDLPEVLVPGHCSDLNGECIDVGTYSFVNDVLAVLPEGVLYRRSSVPGMLAGSRGQLEFRQLTNERLRVIIDRYIRLVKWVHRGSKLEQIYQPCTRDWAALVLDAAGDSRRVRELRRLVAYPIFLKGLELAKPGWNDECGVFYDEPEELEGLTDNPPEMTIEEIHAVLDNLLVDFPFKHDCPESLGGGSASKENYLGLLLTVLLQLAIEGNIPMHLLTSPIPRTGKTKLAETVLGGLFLGRPVPAMQLAGAEEEIDKRIISMLLAGMTITHIDNVRDDLDSAHLASLLTSREYKGRLLASNKVPSFRNNLILVASGNNVRATDEICKRTVPIALVPKSDSPEDRRDFKHTDLPNYIREVRRRALGALIRMVLIWRDNQRSLSENLKGGFEHWSQLVGGVLSAAGYTRWRLNERAWLKSADTNTADLRTLVEEWHKKAGETDQTAKELYSLAETLGLFPQAMRSSTEQGRLMSFVKGVLKKYIDAPVGQYIIRRRGDAGSRSVYYLEVVE